MLLSRTRWRTPRQPRLRPRSPMSSRYQILPLRVLHPRSAAGFAPCIAPKALLFALEHGRQPLAHAYALVLIPLLAVAGDVRCLRESRAHLV